MKYHSSDFLCTKCGHQITLPRNQGQQRELFHRKKIYCIRCKEEVNHIEAPIYRDFDHGQQLLDS